jgi:hypothetical protein
MAAEIIGDDIVRRPATFADRRKQTDRRLDTGAGGHGEKLSAISFQRLAF